MPDGGAVDRGAFRVVHQGFSAVISRSGPWLLREARSGGAARRHEREAGLLAALAGRLPVEVPAVASRIAPSPDRPYGAQLMPWLEGDEVDRSVEPSSVAAFLRALHSLDSGPVAESVPGFGEWCRQQRSLEKAGLAALEGRVGPELLDGLGRLLDTLGDRIADCPAPGVVHGDLWYGNLLMRDHRLTGVLDWEYAAIGDPLVDYAALWYLGDDFMTALFAAVGRTPAEVPETVRYYRVLREFTGLLWSIEHDDEQELRESLAKVATVAAEDFTLNGGRP